MKLLLYGVVGAILWTAGLHAAGLADFRDLPSKAMVAVGLTPKAESGTATHPRPNHGEPACAEDALEDCVKKIRDVKRKTSAAASQLSALAKEQGRLEKERTALRKQAEEEARKVAAVLGFFGGLDAKPTEPAEPKAKIPLATIEKPSTEWIRVGVLAVLSGKCWVYQAVEMSGTGALRLENSGRIITDASGVIWSPGMYRRWQALVSRQM